jgi:hypothetical protein
MKLDTSKKEKEVRRKKEFFWPVLKVTNCSKILTVWIAWEMRRCIREKRHYTILLKQRKRFKNFKLAHFISKGSHRKKAFGIVVSYNAQYLEVVCSSPLVEEKILFEWKRGRNFKGRTFWRADIYLVCGWIVDFD